MVNPTHPNSRILQCGFSFRLIDHQSGSQNWWFGLVVCGFEPLALVEGNRESHSLTTTTVCLVVREWFPIYPLQLGPPVVPFYAFFGEGSPT